MFQKSSPSSWSKDLSLLKKYPGDALLHLVDFGLVSTLFLVPLFYGGRHPWGRLLLAALVGSTAIIWCFRKLVRGDQRMPRSGVEWLLLAGALLLILQLIPLPASWLHFLSPALAETLPVRTGQNNLILSQWNRLSFTPILTQGALVTYLSYCLIFLIAYQRIESPRDIRRMLRWIVLAAIGMALFGLAQFLFSNGKFFWFIQHPTRDTYRVVRGPFVNENHYGHFLALGIGPILWWILSEMRRSKQKGFGSHDASASLDVSKIIGLSIGLGCICLAGVLSLSKGGIIVLLTAFVFSTLGFFILKLIGKKTFATIASVGLLLMIAVGLHGSDPLSREWEKITSGSVEELDGGSARRKIWKANIDTAIAYPWVGTGAGSHRDAYPLFYAEGDGPEFVFAESGYLEVLSETGGIGFALLLIGLVIIGRWVCIAFLQSKSDKDKALAIACAAGLLISCLHAIFDFAWYIPSCMFITLLLTACIARLSHWTKSKNPVKQPAFALNRLAWAVACFALVSLTLAMTKDRIGPALHANYWDHYFSLSLASNDYGQGGMKGSLVRALGKVDANDPDVVDDLINWLEEAIQHDPHNCRTQLRLSSLYLRRFDIAQKESANAMSLSAIRDAALASQFPSKQALDTWLAAAIGENRRDLDLALYHTKRSLELCPLLGQAYLQLAELAFLQGEGAEQKSLYVSQALSVRPHDGAILFSAGREEALAGNPDKAIQLWKRSFHAGHQHQIRLVGLLANTLPPETFIKSFEPDTAGARFLYKHYEKAGLQEPMMTTGSYLVDRLAKEAKDAEPSQASKYWFEIHNVCRRMEQTEAAKKAGERAIFLQPNDYPIRKAFAAFLYNEEYYDQAIDQYEWCIRRHPQDEYLQARLQNSIEQNIRANNALHAIEQSENTELR